MKRLSSIWLVAGLLMILAATAACTSNDPGASVLGRSGVGIADRVTVMADPQEIVIDPEDPNTPTDPDTGEALGESTISALVRDESGDPEDKVEVVFQTDGGRLKSAGQPVMTDEMGIAEDTLIVAESDPDEITVQASAGEDRGTVTVTKTVVQANQPPVADAGDDQMIECGDDVTLDGSASTDPDSTPDTNDDIVLFEWTLGMEELGEGEMLTLSSADLGTGAHTITLTVTDSEGATDSDDTVITIEDNTPPDVTVSLDPSTIWPPNHKWVAVHAELTMVDACSSIDDMAITLLSVESNESANANGDGNTEPDIRGAEAGTEDYDFSVRAERAGPGSGRIYTATYQVADAEGNDTTASAEARVPHDQGGED
jgi:hypothetical protein